MTHPEPPITPSAEEILKEVSNLIDRYEVVPLFSETRVAHIHKVYDAFPSIAQAFEKMHQENKRMREWIKENCTETSCWGNRNSECFSCQACTFLESFSPPQ